MTTKRNSNEDHRSESELASNKLVLYRLEQVETGVKAINNKLDSHENIKKADLIEFRDTIVGRFNEKTNDLQKQVDRLDNEKADKTEVSDLKKLFFSLTSLLGTIMVGIIIAYLTTQGGK